jgi:hypothetical protein
MGASCSVAVASAAELIEFSGRLHGASVDMVTPKFLNPRIRDQVLSSADPLYVAA